MRVSFTKMHGIGNDFILINGFIYNLNNLSNLSKKICDRHFGIGGDGLIIALPPEDRKNDFQMKIFNSDGSEAEMCGNGIRCFARFLQNEGLTKKNKLKIETLAGIITPEKIRTEARHNQIRVNMGRPRFKPKQIPFETEEKIDYVQDYPLTVEDETFAISCVSMGNPHAIVFTDNVEQYPLEKWGRAIENHPLFPAKTNVEFIQIINKKEIIMKVWERGSGITLACGTGAAASVVAGICNNLLDNEVLVHLPGGDLIIEWYQEDVFMIGPAETVFYGEFEVEE